MNKEEKLLYSLMAVKEIIETWDIDVEVTLTKDGNKHTINAYEEIERCVVECINNTQPYKFEDLKIGMNKKELNLKDCEMCLNQFIEDTNYGRGDMVFNDHDEEIDTLRQLIKEHFELIEILKEVGWSGFGLDELKTIIKAGQYNAEKLNSLRNPQPYKFEDLKEEMWVWDNVESECVRVLKTYITDDEHEYYTPGVRVIRTGYEYNWQEIGFRENRFFPVQKANVGER